MVQSRDEMLVNDKEAYAKAASVYLEGLDPNNVMILKCMSTLDSAQLQIKNYVEDKKYNVLSPRQKNALKKSFGQRCRS